MVRLRGLPRGPTCGPTVPGATVRGATRVHHRPHRLLYSQGLSMSPLANSLFQSFSPRGLRPVFSNSKSLKWELLWSCVRALKTDVKRGVRSTYGRFVCKSKGFHERLKILDIREATGHLSNLEFTTSIDGK